MAFDPARIDDDSCADGHLDSDPIYEVLLTIDDRQVTGRLTVEDASGPNHMFFSQGKPVGVQLAEYFHPLGQLLLELGRITGATFVRAQRLISECNRQPGQVFKELGILDDEGLRDVLAIQARKKAEHFVRLGSRPFTFCRGPAFLSGFNSTPLDIHAVIFLAVRQQMGPEARASFLEAAKESEVLLRVQDGRLLPAPLATYGFGPPEERFLQRIAQGVEKVAGLAETGTLPRDEMAVLLRYLELVGWLEVRAPAPAPKSVPEGFDDVFSSSQDTPEVAPLPNVEAAVPAAVEPAERTEPRYPLPKRPRDIHDVPTVPQGVATPGDGPLEPMPMSMAASDMPTAPDKKAPQFRSVLFNAEGQADAEQAQQIAEPLPPPKKKKVKRQQPLPSEGSGQIVMETRKEKTSITSLPSIVIADDDT